MLLDTSTWIEFFQGSEKGKKIKSIIEENKVYTCVVTIAEITNWCLKNRLNPEQYVKTIEQNSIILSPSIEIYKIAGQVNFDNKKQIKNWGMMDSIIYSTAKFYNLTVLTLDNHFKNLENTEVL